MVMEKIEWDLSVIFNDEESLRSAMTSVSKKSEALESKYRGRLASLSPKDLNECIREFESLDLELYDIVLYAFLTFNANMTLEKSQSLFDRAAKLDAEIDKRLAFFTLELGSILKGNPKLTEDPSLGNYRHMLERTLRNAKHLLTEPEERIILEKDLFGVSAWEELQGKWLNTRKFDVVVEGTEKNLPYGEADGLIYHKDRATRESANRAIYGGLGNDGEIFASALRNICNDWVSTSKLRKFSSPMEASIVCNDTSSAVIDNLLRTVEESVSICRKYLKIKAKIMGLDVLWNYDVKAPINGFDRRFTFDEAKDIITRAYSSFGEDYAQAIRDMFEKRRIDADPRYGKKNGAFCSSWDSKKSAFILQSFNGTLKDVYTLAHELGHATHDYYASRRQTLFNSREIMIVAETASIFGELLLTDLLLKEAKSDDERRGILCHVLDSSIDTVFQVSARAWFELSMYRAIEEGRYLDYSTICGLWTDARDRIFGDAVKWLPEMGAEWTMKPHYYMANFRFYNYPYVYAQLFVFAAYQQYLKEGKNFVPKMVEALSSGSSVSPKRIGEILGLDTESSDFWKLGMNQIETFLKELEEIISE